MKKKKKKTSQIFCQLSEVPLTLVNKFFLQGFKYLMLFIKKKKKKKSWKHFQGEISVLRTLGMQYVVSS